MADFKGRHFTGEVILWVVRWHLMFPVSYRDLELMLADRGVAVDHSTIFRWIQAYAAELEKRLRPHLRLSNGSWRVDETYIKIKGRWTYLYRAVDGRGQTIDFLLSTRRDAAAAKRFFRKTLGQPHTVNPRTITVDKNAAYPKAVAEMKGAGELWGSVANSVEEPSVCLRQALVRRRVGTVQRRRLPEPSCRGRRSSEPAPSSSSPSPRSQPRFVGRFGSWRSRAPARSSV